MNIDIKKGWGFILNKVRKHPIFTRILTQIIVFITTFGWHNQSAFWHVVCLGGMIVMSALSISDGKRRKGELVKSTDVVEIFQEAIEELVENGNVTIDGIAKADDMIESQDDINQTKTEEESGKIKEEAQWETEDKNTKDDEIQT